MIFRYVSSLILIFYAEVCFAQQNIMSWNYDWDDNIFYMPTKVVLFDYDSEETIKVSTQEFAVVRDFLKDGIMVGGPYEGFGINGDRAHGTFRYFGDEGFRKDFNIFKRQFDRQMQEHFETSKGPAWDSFITSLSTPATAKWTTIITARSHSPQSIYETLEGLKQRGTIRYLPNLEHIYPVTHRKFGEENAKNPSLGKVRIQLQLLDAIEGVGVNDETFAMTNQDGTAHAPLHVWGFSDDDWGNYRKTYEALANDVAKGRWPHVKIILFFTGKNHPAHAPESTVIRNDGRQRLLQPSELKEIAGIAFQKEELSLELIPD